MTVYLRKRLLLSCLLLSCISVRAQFLMDMIDTTKDMGRGVLSMYKRFDHIRIWGYIQPQFQAASADGIQSFAGGDFPPHSNSRFTIRRGRIRFDYALFDKLDRPKLQFVFQFDGTERGVFIRDFWGRIWENKLQSFALTAGMFARPFGYEVNLGSSDREAPERGRMSQTLMKSERDLGLMVSYQPRKTEAKFKWLKIDMGIFNGQGVTGPSEFDDYKDFIGQIMIQPLKVSRNVLVSGGISYLNGGLVQLSKYSYQMPEEAHGDKAFQVDSSEENIGRKSPRIYYGVNAQLKIKHAWGNTELRGEFWEGTQTGTRTTSETPGSIPTTNLGIPLPYYIRKFNGAFFCFLQNIVNTKHQLGVKFDWYDPNTQVKENEIGKPGTNTTETDIKYSTLGFGYLYYINENLKLTLWYDWVQNEKTQVPGHLEDVPDNVFTCRLQFRF